MIIGGSVILLAAISGGILQWFSLTKKQQAEQKQQEEQRVIYRNLAEVIDDFHGDVETISASADSREKLQEELRRLKTYSQQAEDKLRAVDFRSADSSALSGAIDKSNKYLRGFADFANLAIDKATLSARGKKMVQVIDSCRQNLRLPDSLSLDEADILAAVSRAAKLANNFTRFTQPHFPPKVVIIRDESRRYRKSVPSVGYYLAGSCRLTAGDLWGKSSWELDVMRNEIFARHGRRFQRRDLQTYFNSQYWYNPCSGPIGTMWTPLNDTEKYNASFILSYQKTLE